MAALQTLSVNVPGQVKSATKVEAKLPDGRTLLVLSGMAVTNWEVNDSSQVHIGETDVRLGVYGSRLDQWSVFLGLSNFGNGSEDNSPFVFAADSANVRREDALGGELVLNFKPALMGDYSALLQVSYQVVATLVSITPRIAGTITWPRPYFVPPTEDVAGVADQLEVVANHYVHPPGELAPTLTPVARGQIVRLDAQPNNYVAHYLIENPPLTQQLQVMAFIGPKFTIAQPGRRNATQVTLPLVFTLTGAAPTIDGVNFVVDETVIR